MGDDLSTYRGRIGTFRRIKVQNKVIGMGLDVGSQFFTGLLIMVLLMIGGVELNPGPENENDTQSIKEMLAEQTKLLQENHEKLRMDLNNMKVSMEANMNNWNNIKDDTEMLKKENKDLKHRLETLEYKERKKNIIISGLKEVNNSRKEDTYGMVLNFLEEQLHQNFTELHVNDAYRIGRSGSRRLICVQFVSARIKDQVMRRKKMLRGTGVWIEEDFSPEIRQNRKLLIPYMLEARRQGMFATLQGKFLKMDNKMVDLEYCIKNFKGNSVSSSESRPLGEGQRTRMLVNSEQSSVSDNFVHSQTVHTNEEAAVRRGSVISAPSQQKTPAAEAVSLSRHNATSEVRDDVSEAEGDVIDKTKSNSDAREARLKKKNVWFVDSNNKPGPSNSNKGYREAFSVDRSSNYQSTLDIVSSPNGSLLSLNREQGRLGYNLRNANHDKRNRSP